MDMPKRGGAGKVVEGRTLIGMTPAFGQRARTFPQRRVDSRISSSVAPAANVSTIKETQIRVPLMRGLP